VALKLAASPCSRISKAEVRQPPRWLKPGDTVEVDIDRVGLLRNPIVAED
jgi:2-keto-4-pentenoate hydratase/2-oxohepta-3-ene-1,7-dioic acid hydratase in catechol pathway